MNTNINDVTAISVGIQMRPDAMPPPPSCDPSTLCSRGGSKNRVVVVLGFSVFVSGFSWVTVEISGSVVVSSKTFPDWCNNVT